MLSNPSAPGRDYVLHATDETVTEFAIEPYAAEAPLHVVALRTPQAKYATYSNFVPDSIKLLSAGREVELYDYSIEQGRMELANEAGHSPLEGKLSAQLERAITHELREPLPPRLQGAHKRGLADYFNTASLAALKAAAVRRKRAEREGEIPPEGGHGGEAEAEEAGAGAQASSKLHARRHAGRRGRRRRRAG
jgi:hypothetical protein